LHPQDEDDEDELAIFGGQTRVLVTKLLSKQQRARQESLPISFASSHSSPISPAGDSDSSTPSSDSTPEVHPSLVEYLNQFSHSAFPSSPPQNGPLPPAPLPYLQPQVQPPSFNEGSMDWASGQWSQSGKPPPPPDDPTTLFNMTFHGPMSFEPPILFDGNSDSPPYGNPDLGMMTSGESGMDEQWMSFMRDSGILGPSPSAPL
jgi:hypothetical protein